MRKMHGVRIGYCRRRPRLPRLDIGRITVYEEMGQVYWSGSQE